MCAQMYKKLSVGAPCAVAGALRSHTTLSATDLSVRVAPAPQPSLKNLIKTSLYKQTTQIPTKSPKHKVLFQIPKVTAFIPFQPATVISSKFYLFRFIEAVVSLDLLWI